MSDLQEQFEMAYRDAQRMREHLSDKRLLELYALHKQATKGDVIGDETNDPDSSRAKYIMRTRLKGMPKEKAMEDCIALVEKLKAEPEPLFTIAGCPLDSNWRDWDLFGPNQYFKLPPELEAISKAAQAVKRGAEIQTVEAEWESAADDVRFVPAPKGTSFAKGSPTHQHTEFGLDGHLIHIDRVGATRGGPGRSIVEYRIYLDGQFAGHGGRGGTSLGGGGDSLPAVALLGQDKILTVSEDWANPPQYSVIQVWRHK
jgi:acyl-CoA-binding protein